MKNNQQEKNSRSTSSTSLFPRLLRGLHGPGRDGRRGLDRPAEGAGSARREVVRAVQVEQKERERVFSSFRFFSLFFLQSSSPLLFSSPSYSSSPKNGARPHHRRLSVPHGEGRGRGGSGGGDGRRAGARGGGDGEREFRFRWPKRAESDQIGASRVHPLFLSPSFKYEITISGALQHAPRRLRQEDA